LKDQFYFLAQNIENDCKTAPVAEMTTSGSRQRLFSY
jgi:hypothetical protein